MKYKQIGIEEREKIQRWIWEKKTIRWMGRELKRSASTVARELRRNYPEKHKVYTPRLANERAMKKRKKRGREKRLKNEKIRKYVKEKLKIRWSPEQIAGKIYEEIKEKISHEAIYQYIYQQIYRDGYGYVKPGSEDLRIYLRRRRKRREHKGCRGCKRVLTQENPSIETRPEIVEKRTRIGDWESDSVASKGRKAGINTIVERKTGLVYITKLKDRTSKETAEVILKRLRKLPRSKRKTITFDNGTENQRWKKIEEELRVKCYFAHPYSAWERGTNENTNGLIRDYFPKKTDFDKITEEELRQVEELLNNRPRKRLGWKSPLQVFTVALHY